MGWFHGIFIYTTSLEAKKAVNKHFEQFSPLLINNQHYHLHFTSTGFIYAQGLGINNRGIDDEDEAALLNKISVVYYNILRTAPSFLYALAGLEVEEAITYNELIDDPNWMIGINGFVINNQFYQEIITPELEVFDGFTDFVDGYRWIPFVENKP